jgi:putative tricarboxylic transport membrane protein
MDYIHYLPYILAGTIYGFIFGIVPIAGATTGLLTVYAFMDYFRADPYSLVVFTTALVIAASVGDLFSSVVMNIPGGGGSAATMVDGFPLAKRGEGARALSASVFSACGQGLIWGILVFAFLPYYSNIVLYFGIPEMLCFILLALTTVTFVNNEYWFRGLLGVILGLFLGLIGTDPVSNAQRFTGGWFYLAHGIQVLPLLAGLLAMPEILETLFQKAELTPQPKNVIKQMIQGAKDAWQYRWDSIRSGIIGGFIGLLPGVGGAVVDWMAYSQTVAAGKKDKIPFGEGNIRGVVGAEGANMAQKSTAYVPTILFGVPAAPFEVIVMSLFMYVGLEMGSPTLLADPKFFNALNYSFIVSLSLTFVISLLFIRWATLLTRIPVKYYFIPLIGLIFWSCAEYTGGWEDYAMLIFCTVLGLALKYFKVSRACVLIGFVLCPRIELVGKQFFSIYEIQEMLHHPIAMGLIFATIISIVYGIFFSKTKINYY